MVCYARRDSSGRFARFDGGADDEDNHSPTVIWIPKDDVVIARGGDDTQRLFWCLPIFPSLARMLNVAIITLLFRPLGG